MVDVPVQIQVNQVLLNGNTEIDFFLIHLLLKQGSDLLLHIPELENLLVAVESTLHDLRVVEVLQNYLQKLLCLLDEIIVDVLVRLV